MTMKKLENGCRKPGSCSYNIRQTVQHPRPKLFVAILVISVLVLVVLYGCLLRHIKMDAGYRYIQVPNILNLQCSEIEKMNSRVSPDSEFKLNAISVETNIKEDNLKWNNRTFQRSKLATQFPSIYSDFETISVMIHDIIATYHQNAPGDLRIEAEIDVSCSQNDTEDILCVTPPRFIGKLKNPCWIDTDGRFMCLPYFQLIGFSKCASSDLFARICTHPQVLANKGGNSKETKWWPRLRYGIYKYKGQRDSRKQTFDDYLNYFSEAATYISQNNSLITGDGTPSDVWDFAGWPMIPQNKGLSEPLVLTPHLIRHINPHVKMIVILRDPVERLYSDFFSRGGISPRGFHQRVVDTIVRLHTCVRNTTLRSCVFSWEYRLAEKTRIHIGFYSLYLKEWFRVFSRKQFQFLTTEEYSQNITKNMRKIFSFLEIDALSDSMLNQITKNDRRNVSLKKKKVDPMLQSTRKILMELYHPFNVELSLLLHDNKYLWNVDIGT